MHVSINQFLSEHLIAKKEFPETSEDLQLFENDWDGFVIYPPCAKKLKDHRINERIGLAPVGTQFTVRHGLEGLFTKFLGTLKLIKLGIS